MKTCSDCHTTKSFSEFNQRKRSKDGLMTNCKQCHRNRNKYLYAQNKKAYITRSLDNKRKIAIWMRDIKRNLVCEKCGESKPWRLCFHHKDASTKLFNISEYYSIYSRDKILAEIGKCICVCHNCHADIHYEELYLSQ